MTKVTARLLILAFSFAPGAILAADTGPAVQSAPRDSALERARDAIAKNDWAGAQSVLREAIAREPGNADYHNLFAYAHRKGENPDMSLVFKHYNPSLVLDPKHRGAHEYVGEAYLMVGNPAKAKEHLAQLDKLCLFSCSEFTDLKNAIAAHEKRAAAR